MGKYATGERIAASSRMAWIALAGFVALAAVTGHAGAQEAPVGAPPAIEAPAPLAGPAATPAIGTVPAAQDTTPPLAAPAQAVVPTEAPAAPATTARSIVPPAGSEPSPAIPASPVSADAFAPSPAAPPLAAAAHIAADLSPWGMFLAADVVVKSVMIGLALASLVTWTICLAKGLEVLAAKARLRGALREVLGARTLGDLAESLGGRRDPAAQMVAAARYEVEASAPAIETESAGGLLDRVASHLSRIEARAGRRLTLGTGLLATIGATAPFVGLFGTVWGIMNSFIGISETQTTNLAVVAPGIAEALLATALGLVAAIPAVVIYNHFARSVAAYRALLADTAAGVERLVSRDLDLRRLAAPAFRRAAE